MMFNSPMLSKKELNKRMRQIPSERKSTSSVQENKLVGKENKFTKLHSKSKPVNIDNDSVSLSERFSVPRNVYSEPKSIHSIKENKLVGKENKFVVNLSNKPKKNPIVINSPMLSKKELNKRMREIPSERKSANHN